MCRLFPLAIVIAAVACSDQAVPILDPSESDQRPSFSTTSTPRYSGRAVAAQSTASGFTLKVVEAGPLPPRGGTQSASLPSASIPGVLTASTLNASVDGRFRRSVSTASIGSVTITAGGNTVRVTKLAATARAECYNRTSGSSSIAGLIVNDAPVSLTSAPNQTFTLPNGKLVVNEQRRSTNSITVIGLHLLITNGPDVQLSRTEGGIIC